MIEGREKINKRANRERMEDPLVILAERGLSDEGQGGGGYSSGKIYYRNPHRSECQALGRGGKFPFHINEYNSSSLLLPYILYFFYDFFSSLVKHRKFFSRPLTVILPVRQWVYTAECGRMT